MNGRCVLTILVLAAGASRLSADPSVFSAKVLAAWKDADAVTGYAWWQRHRLVNFSEMHLEGDSMLEVPAFQFKKFEPDSLVHLPVPDTAFGISLAGSQPSRADMKALGKMTRLQYLDLSASKLTDALLADLTKLSDLQVLSLRQCDVGDEGMKHICRLKQLKALDLTGTRVTDFCLGDLIALKSLQALHFGAGSVTDTGITDIGKFASLRELKLAGTRVSNDGLSNLRSMKSLLRLQLGSEVDDEGMRVIGRMKQLADLDLETTKVTDDGLKSLSGLRLKSLRTPRTARTDLGLKYYLAITPAPSELNLADWTITDVAMKDIGKLTNLRSLNLSKAKVTDATLREINGLVQLRSLDLSMTKVTDIGLKELIPMRQLRVLNVAGTKVTPQGIALLQESLPDVQATAR